MRRVNSKGFARRIFHLAATMNATRAQLKAQYERAKRLGWLPYFAEAAADHTEGIFDAADLIGIGSRETNLDPKYNRIKGDGGHGHGLMQIDDRSFPRFTASDDWKDPQLNIDKGASVLREKWDDYQTHTGKKVQVSNQAFLVPKLAGASAQRIVIASYNAGRGAWRGSALKGDPDRYTTGHDYSEDVMARASVFREFLSKESKSAAPLKSTGNSATNDAASETSSANQQETAKTTEPPLNNIADPTTEQNVAVVREEKLGFWQTLWKKFGAAIAGIGGADRLTTFAQQAQTFGLSATFWERLFYVVAVGAAVWIVAEICRWFFVVYMKRNRTDTLVLANSTPNNSVNVIRPEEVAKYQAAGWGIVQRS
jgi:hypothetical protein